MPSPSATAELPAEFDAALYAAHPRNADLAALDPATLAAHYTHYGRDEGRPCSAVDSRAAFLALVPHDGAVLEIGPSCTPCFPPDSIPHLRYLDVRSTEELRTEVGGMPWGDPAKVPEIDFVWRGEPYRELTSERFDAIVSSHNIEHQPCLVTHLTDLAALLRPGGRVFLVVPDRRYCFDHFLPDSTITDVLAAFVERRTRHSPRSVLEHRLRLAHNDAAAHWRGDHGEDPCRRPVDATTVERIAAALRELRQPSGYIDVHAWQFTPDSCRDLLEALAIAGLSPLRVERVYRTIASANEFYMVLRVAA